MSKTWRVQRPAIVWIETEVKAETLEHALDIADEQFTKGEYSEDLDSSEIDWSRYWVEDENEETHTSEVLEK
jgi:hypothetical protein